MKKLIASGIGTKALKLYASLTVGASLALAFWFATSPSALAQETCQVCHKRSQTLSFPCNSLEYRRHLDHGDAMGACSVTPVSNP